MKPQTIGTSFRNTLWSGNVSAPVFQPLGMAKGSVFAPITAPQVPPFGHARARRTASIHRGATISIADVKVLALNRDLPQVQLQDANARASGL